MRKRRGAKGFSATTNLAYIISISNSREWGDMIDRPDSQSAFPFTPTDGDNAHTELDSAGQAILKLLHKAASVAEVNSRSALEMAQKLSRELQEAENRIAELELEISFTERRLNTLNNGFTKSPQRLKIALLTNYKRSGGTYSGDHNPGL